VPALVTSRFRLWLLCGTAALFLLAAGTANAATAHAPPCWEQLLGEWYTGSITTIYPHSCYQQAINHLPSNISEYSSAKQDILAAEAAAAHHKSYKEQNVTGLASSSGQPPTSGPTGVTLFFKEITPGNPQSFPLPLLILGALAIVLVIAGGAGMLWQRRHPPGTTDQSP
jgi:drug/metabolite transporter (DMT)-like permease